MNGPGATTSVVICAYTEERWEQMQMALRSVESQVPVPHQIVLVIDHNDSLLQQARAQWPGHVVVPNAHRRGLSGARNAGVAVSTGDVIAFLDDDAIADPGWLGRLASHFTDEQVGAVGGAVRPDWSVRRPSWFPDEFLWVVGCSYRGLPTEIQQVRNPIGASMAFRRQLLIETGGFREEVGRVGKVPIGCEETEISIRVGRLGSSVLYDPSATASHLVTAERATWRYFRQRCLAEGRSKAVVASMAGASDALSSERTYATKVLPRGVASGLRSVLIGPGRVAALGRIGAIGAGLVVTGIGYVDATVRQRVSGGYRIDGSRAAPV